MEHRCEAITTKGRRCRKKADYYRKYDNREYLSCKQHHLYFRPHPVVVRRKMEVDDGEQ